jgi:hypothetical protein
MRMDNISTRPGWRMIVLHKVGAESIEVMYVWNHVHYDGSIGKIFHQQLLRHLNESTQIEEPVAGPERLILNLPDPPDRLPPNPVTLCS